MKLRQIVWLIFIGLCMASPTFALTLEKMESIENVEGKVAVISDGPNICRIFALNGRSDASIDCKTEQSQATPLSQETKIEFKWDVLSQGIVMRKAVAGRICYLYGSKRSSRSGSMSCP